MNANATAEAIRDNVTDIRNTAASKILSAADRVQEAIDNNPKAIQHAKDAAYAVGQGAVLGTAAGVGVYCMNKVFGWLSS